MQSSDWSQETFLASLASAAGAASNEEKLADVFALHNVEIVVHQAASTKDLDLMMSLFCR
jgi:hypothetical protein